MHKSWTKNVDAHTGEAGNDIPGVELGLNDWDVAAERNVTFERRLSM
jgi:hypothetical protein